MKALRTIYRIVSNGCIFFTFFALALYTGGVIVSGSEREWIPTLSMLYSTLVFSLAFSAVNEFAMQSRIPTVLRVLAHYVVTLLMFYVLFIRFGNYSGNASGVFLILSIFTILYAACALAVLIVRSVRTAHRQQTTAYDKQFQIDRKQK